MQLPADVDAVQVGHVPVQHQRVEGGLARRLERRLAFVDDRHREPARRSPSRATIAIDSSSSANRMCIGLQAYGLRAT